MKYLLRFYWSHRNPIKRFFMLFAALLLIIFAAFGIKKAGDKIYSTFSPEDNKKPGMTAANPKVSGNRTDEAGKEAVKATGDYNFGEALQKAIFFYDCQRSGKLDKSKLRMNWRGDSGLNDGKDSGVDLTGGWYDAGDNVKFGLPMAYSAAMLGWSIYEYKDAFVKSGQLDYMLDNIKWAADYFIKCHTKQDEFYYQVGDGNTDHGWWGPAEVMQMKRPSYKVDRSRPGSAVTAETSAALAVTSIIFKEVDPSYSSKCLKHARELFEFADSTKSDAGYTEADAFYKSWSGFYDELSWAGAWLYLATKDAKYLDKAESYVAEWKTEPQSTAVAYKWAQSWDDVHYGAQLLLARITGKTVYKESVERNLDFWSGAGNGEKIKYTPKGLAWLDQWGSLRYATTEAFLAYIYSDWDGCEAGKVPEYREFAKSQVEYALGSTGRSFVVGFGTAPPEHPHHRTAHGSWADSQSVPDHHRHTLYGALVGGPDSSDGYKDEIGNYTANEVACDYNAGFVGALAKMYLLYGGDPIKDFKAVEEPEDEFFVEAGVNSSSTDYVEIKAVLNNRSGWPARASEKLSFKYFMDLSELKQAGKPINGLKVSLSYNQGAKISDIKQFKNDIYYVAVDFSGVIIYPGGQSSYKKEVQFRISAPGGAGYFKPDNDYSYKGLSSGTLIKSVYIPVYEDGIKVFGYEPGDSVQKEDSPAKASDNADAAVNTGKADNAVLPTPKPSATATAPQNLSSQPKTGQAAGTGSIAVQFANTNTTQRLNSIYLKFKLTNTGNLPVRLADIKLRYYYTADGEKKQNFWCDWSNIGNGAVNGKFVKLASARSNADYYLEIGFAEGANNINPGSTVEVQARFAKDDWSEYNQSQDYSFNSSTNAYADWNKITMCVSGNLKYGIEP